MSCEGHLYSWPNSGHGQGFNCQLCHHTGRVSSAPCLKIVVLWVGGFWFCLQGNFSMWWLASSGPIWKRGHWDGQNVGQGTVEQLWAKSKSKQFFCLNFSLQPLAGAVDLCSRCQPIDRWRARFARLSHSELQEFQVSFFGILMDFGLCNHSFHPTAPVRRSRIWKTPSCMIWPRPRLDALSEQSK